MCILSQLEKGKPDSVPILQVALELPTWNNTRSTEYQLFPMTAGAQTISNSEMNPAVSRESFLIWPNSLHIIGHVTRHPTNRRSGQGANILRSHCRGPGFDLWSRN